MGNYIPCICGSRKSLQQCCGSWLLRQSKKPEVIKPPAPKSNESDTKCYLNHENDCSGPITREHYVSAAVLKEVDGVLRVSGMPWLDVEEHRELPVSALVARILCKRHNSCFSALDSEMARFVRTLKGYTLSTISATSRFEVFSGHDLERWIWKTLFGLAVSGNIQVDQGAALRSSPEARWGDLLFDRVRDDAKRGFYVQSEGQTSDLSFHASPLVNKAKQNLQGLVCVVLGFNLLATTCEVNVEGGVYRPSMICFVSNEGTRVIRVSWMQAGPTELIAFFHRGPSTNGPLS